MMKFQAKTDLKAAEPLTKAQATTLTKRIREHIDAAWQDITKAYEGKAWKPLGYASWEAYVKAEFDMTRRRSYQILDQGRVINAISEATGNVYHGTQITEREAREIKDDLPAVTAEISARVERGEEPKKAAVETIAEKRAEKAKAKADKQAQQAEHDRQRDEARAKLPEEVKQAEAAREAAVSAAKTKKTAGLTDAERVAELEETVRILEGDNAELKAENAKFGDMKVLFDQGGFEAVIAAKDEQIRVLNTRVASESADKASWASTAKFWKEKAQALGYSADIVIPLDDTPTEFGGVA